MIKRVLKIIWGYIFGVTLALDVLGNALMGGSPYRKISTRYGKMGHRTWLCDFLNIFEKNHCKKSYERYKERILYEYKEILSKQLSEDWNEYLKDYELTNKPNWNFYNPKDI